MLIKYPYTDEEYQTMNASIKDPAERQKRIDKLKELHYAEKYLTPRQGTRLYTIPVTDIAEVIPGGCIKPGSVFIVDGKHMTVSELADLYGISGPSMARRLERLQKNNLPGVGALRQKDSRFGKTTTREVYIRKEVFPMAVVYKVLGYSSEQSLASVLGSAYAVAANKNKRPCSFSDRIVVAEGVLARKHATWMDYIGARAYGVHRDIPPVYEELESVGAPYLPERLHPTAPGKDFLIALDKISNMSDGWEARMEARELA